MAKTKYGQLKKLANILYCTITVNIKFNNKLLLVRSRNFKTYDNSFKTPSKLYNVRRLLLLTVPRVLLLWGLYLSAGLRVRIVRVFTLSSLSLSSGSARGGEGASEGTSSPGSAKRTLLAVFTSAW